MLIEISYLISKQTYLWIEIKVDLNPKTSVGRDQDPYFVASKDTNPESKIVTYVKITCDKFAFIVLSPDSRLKKNRPDLDPV